MTRREALVVLGVAVASIVAGLTWLFGPLVLIGAGVLVAVAAFLFEVRE